MYNREYTPEKITHLNENEIFVFGSNLAGAHGSGAARLAYERFGAVWGLGVGLQGQSYAIPTMHGGVEAIKPYVVEFIDFAKLHPEFTFLVTRIGCGIAGFSEKDIAPLFATSIDIENIILPKSFVSVIVAAERYTNEMTTMARLKLSPEDEVSFLKGQKEKSDRDNRTNCGLSNYLCSIRSKRPVPKGQIAIARDFAIVLNDNGHQTLIGRNEDFKQLHSSMRFNKVAAAFCGYMALTERGNIITCGKTREFDRSYEIESMNRVKDVVASEGHTVVLFNDGTVKSIDEPGGWEGVPQHCRVVEGWQEIKQVAVGFNNIMCLTEAGKVLYHSVNRHTNPHFYDNCSDIVQIDCYSHYYGTDSSAVLHRDGTVSSDTFEGVEKWNDIIQISVGADIIVGLKSDGTIVMIDHRNERSAALKWRNLACIECKFFNIVGITNEGEILSL